MQRFKVGDKAIYTSDVQPAYTGQEVTIVDLDRVHHIAGVRGRDGEYFAAFWDEIKKIE